MTMNAKKNKPIFYAWIISLGMVVAILINSCSSGGITFIPGSGNKNDLDHIRVECTSDCNRNTPVAMDILFIHDNKIAPLLAALNGPEWFIRKQELMMRYDNELGLANLEIVPLSVIDRVSLPKNHKKAVSVLLFANYLSGKGQFVAELGHFKALNIRLERERYQLEAIKK